MSGDNKPLIVVAGLPGKMATKFTERLIQDTAKGKLEVYNIGLTGDN